MESALTVEPSKSISEFYNVPLGPEHDVSPHPVGPSLVQGIDVVILAFLSPYLKIEKHLWLISIDIMTINKINICLNLQYCIISVSNKI